MATIRVNDKEFTKQTEAWKKAIKSHGKWSVKEVGDEILRISINGFPGSPQVPHDLGILQTSASNQDKDDKSVTIGFNTEYAARLHEHPEYNFQKGRKAKYLEDPIKHNLRHLGQFFSDKVRTIKQP